jgi:hypothetical protein
MATRKATLMVCDNPRCPDKSEYEVTPQDPSAPGYHLGKGHYDLAGGGPIPATYACSEDCIVPALRANMDRSEGKDPLTGTYPR